MSAFLETTWFLWWLFAVAIVVWWSLRWFDDEEIPPYKRPPHWRNLYRQALVERDETELDIRIQEAEGAILLELATQLFAHNSRERTALQEAMNNLHNLRQTDSGRSDHSRVA